MSETASSGLHALPTLRCLPLIDRTLREIATLNRSLVFLIACALVPYLAAREAFSEMTSVPVEIQALFMREIFFLFAYLWVGGIVLGLFSAVTVSGFISREMGSGTLLILVSKPLHRWEIVLGKFLAFLIYILVLETIALVSVAYIMVTVTGVHFSVFWYLLARVPFLLVYTTFVAAVFGAITLGLSVLSSSSSKIILVMAGMVILAYFGMFIVRAQFSAYYDTYDLHHIDMGYYMGNVYLLMMESFGYRPTPFLEGIMGSFAGTHDTAGLAGLSEQDQGFILPGLPETGFYTRIESLLIWSGLTIGLMGAAIVRLYRKDVG